MDACDISAAVQGWFLPAEAAMQFQQCVVQQVRPEILVPAAEDKKKKKAAVGESAASLLQLPGVTVEVVRALDKNSRIRSLQVCPPLLLYLDNAMPVLGPAKRLGSSKRSQASQAPQQCCSLVAGTHVAGTQVQQCYPFTVLQFF